MNHIIWHMKAGYSAFIREHASCARIFFLNQFSVESSSSSNVTQKKSLADAVYPVWKAYQYNIKHFLSCCLLCCLFISASSCHSDTFQRAFHCKLSVFVTETVFIDHPVVCIRFLIYIWISKNVKMSEYLVCSVEFGQFLTLDDNPELQLENIVIQLVVLCSG